MVDLKHVHRQVDPTFISILMNLRHGRLLTQDEENILEHHATDVKRDNATKLLPTRDAVRKINEYHMDQLPAAALEMEATDHFRLNREGESELWNLVARTGDAFSALLALAGHRYEYDLKLKHNMQVLLLRNIDQGRGLVNGAVGKIVGFVDMRDENMPRAFNQRQKDKEKFPGQMIYGEHTRYQESQIRHFRDQLPAESRKWPVVQFKNGIKQVVFASCSISELGRKKPYSLLSRTQIPLLAGYAITIHKSQGMTLDSVVVDLAKCWEAGQAYVALSRARSLSGLIVDTLPTKATADPVVEQWMVEHFGEGDPDDCEA